MKKLILAILYIILITAVTLSILNKLKENIEVQAQPEIVQEAIIEEPKAEEIKQPEVVKPIVKSKSIQQPKPVVSPVREAESIVEEPIDWVKAEPKGCPHAEQLTADDPKCVLAM